MDALIARQLDLSELRNARATAYTATGETKNRCQRDREALEALARVFRAYRDYLGLINKLIVTQRSAQQIDEEIKIYAAPGKAGLAHLRGAGQYLYQPATRGFED